MPNASGWHSSISFEAVSGVAMPSLTVSCVTEKNGEKTKKRLEILNQSNDGFYIAREDLRLRGPGDLFGIRQSGD